MSAERLPNEFEIRPELTELSVSETPSTVHGLMTGWLAAGGKLSKSWFGDLLVDPLLEQPADDSQLAAMAKITQAQLTDPEFGFEPLLPDDDDSLTDRASAVFQWAEGFTAGFALAGGTDEQLSEMGREAMGDLVMIARSNLEETAETDEDSLAEIQEYVKVAALLIHSEVAMAGDFRRSLN